MGLEPFDADGQTPLEEEETEGLRIFSIATRAQLDEFEQRNIEEALLWVLGRSFTPQKVFTEKFVQALHVKMYKQVWLWAGRFRKTNKNIGVDKWQIPTALRSLLDDALFWHEKDLYASDEFALRFKHRLVSIHCFPNGNGRHSRLMADIIIEKIFRQPVFTWGGKQLGPVSEVRSNYLKALRAADAGDIGPLIVFARS